MERSQSEILLQFTVSDTGIGIKQENIPRLFNDFIQADSSTTRQYSGTGLGLSICKHLTEQMGGVIWADSTWNVGSDFSFRLTLRIGASDKSLSSSVPDRIKNKKLLLVEDKSNVVESIGKLLESMKFTFEVTDSGDKAHSLVRESLYNEPFDILIIDCRLQKTDGVEDGIKILRDQDILRKPDILFMGSSGDIQELSDISGKKLVWLIS